MRKHRPVAREHVLFTAVLIALTLLAIFLWFKDPAHRPAGESRVGWPATSSPKP